MVTFAQLNAKPTHLAIIPIEFTAEQWIEHTAGQAAKCREAAAETRKILELLAALPSDVTPAEFDKWRDKIAELLGNAVFGVEAFAVFFDAIALAPVVPNPSYGK